MSILLVVQDEGNKKKGGKVFALQEIIVQLRDDTSTGKTMNSWTVWNPLLFKFSS